MAGIIGDQIGFVIAGNTNPNLSTDLDNNTEAVFQNDLYDVDFQVPPWAYYGAWRVHTANNWGITGTLMLSFKDDYYNRIHILPTRIDLGTLASTVSRQISVWNAYTNQSATLNDVLIQNGTGISVVGDTLPYVFTPLQERIWEVRITPNGPPEINASILFDFANVADPLPVIIVGNRAVVLPAVPNVPVTERWRWLTDVHVSYDGTEQRVGLRDVPRRNLSTQLTFESDAEVREQYKTLFSAGGRLFVPYFQYATTIKQNSAAGATVLVFDTAYVDLRDDDYVLLLMENGAVLIQLDAIGASSATTKAPLSIDVPAGTRVIAVYPSILPNNLNLSRLAVNNYATMNLSSEAIYPRDIVRPGGAAGFNTLDGMFILERRPLADDDIDHVFDTGQVMLDAKTGLFDVDISWDFAKVESDLSFLIRRLGRYACQHRSGIDEMDYWRVFCDEMKGSLNNFLLSTYRPDQLLAAEVGVGASGLLLLGPTYVDNFWPALPYHYLALYTDAGIHYAKVTGASKNTEGNCSITFEPSLPSTPGWNVINQVSYLLKQRIADDEVEWSHYQLDSTIRFRTRTVKE